MDSQSSDPYKMPQSNVDNMNDDDYAQLKTISFSGRIGRMRYLAYSFGMMFVFFMLSGIVGAIAIPTLSAQSQGTSEIVAAILMIISYVFMLVASFTLAVRRLNDFDSSGWLSLLFMVPVVNVIFSFVLWLVPGTKGANRYGLKPPPNHAGVIIIVLLVPIVVGILAAVSIPVYMDYVERAKQMQNQ